MERFKPALCFVLIWIFYKRRHKMSAMSQKRRQWHNFLIMVSALTSIQSFRRTTPPPPPGWAMYNQGHPALLSEDVHTSTIITAEKRPPGLRKASPPREETEQTRRGLVGQKKKNKNKRQCITRMRH